VRSTQGSGNRLHSHGQVIHDGLLAVRLLALLLHWRPGLPALQALAGRRGSQRQRRLDIGRPVSAALVVLLA
jgi:hypothetical protein